MIEYAGPNHESRITRSLMYAVIETGGKQYRVEEGRTLTVEENHGPQERYGLVPQRAGQQESAPWDQAVRGTDCDRRQRAGPAARHQGPARRERRAGP